MKRIERLFNELGKVSMRSDDSIYNGITEKQSSESYRLRIEDLYNNAVLDLYGLNEEQRRITIRRIDEVRERQKYFDVPTKETVNALFRDFSAQPEGKRNKSLLDDYQYGKFVLECVSIQKEYLERFASLISEEESQNTIIKTEPNENNDENTDADSNSDTSKVGLKDKAWLTIDETAAFFGLPKNNIKSRKWRVNNDFPYKGYDENKKPYSKVIFHSEDIKAWIKRHK